MAVVYLGIGSNVGDRDANIKRVLDILKENPDIDIKAVSKMIDTEPVGGPPQDNFLNGAIKIETDLLPLELSTQLRMIERRLGRQKDAPRNSPRTMDLDILFYDDVVMDGKSLIIPHPRAAERRFVLEPLSEIAPELIHPRLQKTVKELLEGLLHADPSQSPSAS